MFVRESDMCLHIGNSPSLDRNQHWHAVNFNPSGDGKIGCEYIYLKLTQVHIKIVCYALTPCYFEFVRNSTESVFEINIIIFLWGNGCFLSKKSSNYNLKNFAKRQWNLLL
jgi:hypothetical protein